VKTWSASAVGGAFYYLLGGAGGGIHSPLFGKIMLEACQKIGVEYHLQYWEEDKPKPVISREEFFNRHLLK
jgi:hypothetical protein